MKTLKEKQTRTEADEIYEYRKWCDVIPTLQFRPEWNIRIIPPFGGAIVRFQIEYDKKFVSCYLDCYDELGYYGEPYWEIYPYEGDVYRCAMKDTGTLMEKIGEVLES